MIADPQAVAIKAYALAMADAQRITAAGNVAFAQQYSILVTKANKEAKQRQDDDWARIRTINLSTAAAVNVVPLVGQLVALAATLGLAIAEALKAAGAIPPPPSRDPGTPPVYQIFGKQTHHALQPDVTGYADNGVPFRQSMEALIAESDVDPFARLLPHLPAEQGYDTVPTLSMFKAAVAGLFPTAYAEVGPQPLADATLQGWYQRGFDDRTEGRGQLSWRQISQQVSPGASFEQSRGAYLDGFTDAHAGRRANPAYVSNVDPEVPEGMREEWKRISLLRDMHSPAATPVTPTGGGAVIVVGVGAGLAALLLMAWRLGRRRP